nr:MAG TPA: hypothetical protein [Caudoviricetes sp.]
MSDKLELYVSTDLNTLAFGISQLDQSKIIELFKAVDDMICEYEFTETLAKIFQEIINKENE